MKKTILLIEDHDVLREQISEILKLSQYNVVTADNGKDGIILARDVVPDLILCDIVLPVLDGYGVLHILSKHPVTAAIPFIFLTSKSDMRDWRKGMELGADDYIIRPFEDTDLLNSIESRLRKNEAIKTKLLHSLDNKYQLISKTNKKTLKDLINKKSLSCYKKKEVIFHEGDDIHYLFFINKGKVKTYKTHDDGKEYITKIYNDGDFFGYPCLFDDKVYVDSALVMENSQIYKIPKDEFLTLMYENAEVSEAFMRMLSSRIKEYERQLIGLAYDSVKKRTANTLLRLNQEYRLKEDIDQTPISITRENIAGMAGTTVETVTRCLGEFKENKFIKLYGRSIKIVNSEGLNNIQ